MKLTQNDMMESASKEAQTDSPKEKDPFAEDALAFAGLSRKEKRALKKEILQKRLATMDSKKEQRSYLLLYYRNSIIIGFLLVILLIFAVRFIYNASIPTDLTVFIANEHVTSPGDFIKESYQSYYHLDSKHKVSVITGLDLEETEADYDQDGMIARERLWTSIENDQIDILIGNVACLNYVSSSEDITEIDKALDPDLYEIVKDRCITATDSNGKINDGKPFVAAIDISDTDFVKQCNLSYDTVYLMLPANRYQNNSASIQFIQMLFD